MSGRPPSTYVTCREHGKLQSNHFAETIAEMDNVFAFRGSGRSRQLKLLRLGRETLAELIVELNSAGS